MPEGVKSVFVNAISLTLSGFVRSKSNIAHFCIHSKTTILPMSIVFACHFHGRFGILFTVYLFIICSPFDIIWCPLFKQTVLWKPERKRSMLDMVTMKKSEVNRKYTNFPLGKRQTRTKNKKFEETFYPLSG